VAWLKALLQQAATATAAMQAAPLHQQSYAAMSQCPAAGPCSGPAEAKQEENSPAAIMQQSAASSQFCCGSGGNSNSIDDDPFGLAARSMYLEAERPSNNIIGPAEAAGTLPAAGQLTSNAPLQRSQHRQQHLPRYTSDSDAASLPDMCRSTSAPPMLDLCGYAVAHQGLQQCHQPHSSSSDSPAISTVSKSAATRASQFWRRRGPRRQRHHQQLQNRFAAQTSNDSSDNGQSTHDRRRGAGSDSNPATCSRSSGSDASANQGNAPTKTPGNQPSDHNDGCQVTSNSDDGIGSSGSSSFTQTVKLSTIAADGRCNCHNMPDTTDSSIQGIAQKRHFRWETDDSYPEYADQRCLVGSNGKWNSDGNGISPNANGHTLVVDGHVSSDSLPDAAESINQKIGYKRPSCGDILPIRNYGRGDATIASECAHVADLTPGSKDAPGLIGDAKLQAAFDDLKGRHPDCSNGLLWDMARTHVLFMRS